MSESDVLIGTLDARDCDDLAIASAILTLHEILLARAEAVDQVFDRVAALYPEPNGTGPAPAKPEKPTAKRPAVRATAHLTDEQRDQIIAYADEHGAQAAADEFRLSSAQAVGHIRRARG